MLAGFKSSGTFSICCACVAALLFSGGNVGISIVDLSRAHEESSLDSSFLEASAAHRIELLVKTMPLLPSVAAGWKLGLFHLLQLGPLRFEDVQRNLNISVKGLDTLLEVLVGANLVRQNSSTKLLSVDAEVYQHILASHDIILAHQMISQRQLYYLTESVISGRAEGLLHVFGDYESIYKARAALPAVAKYYDPLAQHLNSDLEIKVAPIFQLLESRSPIYVLDWCGNTGGNAIRVAQAYPHARITMLDLPEQCAKADAAISAAHLEDRVRTKPTDLLVEPISLGENLYDAVYMLHTISEWSYHHLRRFFKAIHRALRPGGILLIDMITSHHTGEYLSGVLRQLPAYFLNTASHVYQNKHFADVIANLKQSGFDRADFHFYLRGKIVSPNALLWRANLDQLENNLYLIISKQATD